MSFRHVILHPLTSPLPSRDEGDPSAGEMGAQIPQVPCSGDVPDPSLVGLLAS